MNTNIVIVTSADRHYAMPLAVMLCSIVRNCRQDVQLQMHVLDGGLTQSQRKKVLQSVGSERCRVMWHNMKERSNRLAEFPVFGHVSLATYYRLLIPEILTEPKAIYIDADVVVLGDLAELWMEPMGNNMLLGVQQGSVTKPVIIAGIEEYGIPEDHPRLSAGVLVINLQKWRNDNPFDEMKRYFIKYHDIIRFWDQDALNVVLADSWGAVPGGWNYLVDCSREIDEPPDNVRANLMRDAKIIHFASATKPWHYYGDHPARGIFFDYVDNTVWAGWRPTPPLAAFSNPHVWGMWLRRLPLLGRMWVWLRGRGA